MSSFRLAFGSIICIAMAGPVAWCAETAGVYQSHSPSRPLPQASERRLAEGPTYYVDAAAGDDAQDGSRQQPWKTLAHSLTRLKPGDTLCLNGGTYYEHVAVTVSGTAEKPITIRSVPGELAILDGGLREFFEAPATAWEPCPQGGAGEYQSTKTYPNLGGVEDGTNVLGNFADSMQPLHGYRLRTDLNCESSYWNLTIKTGDDGAVYCGPGLWYSPATGRIHARLAHTDIKALGSDNYRGETDPRKLPLVVAGHAGGSPLTLSGVQHVIVQDLVIRGAREATVLIQNCADITLDGVTAYGGASPVTVRSSAGLRMIHSACRGLSAPWTFRGALKYRSIESRLFSSGSWNPAPHESRDFELCWSEFTDSVDGVFVGHVRGVRFHHNLVDNVSDDGLFLTAATAYDGTTPGGDVHIHDNLLSRCLTTFAFGVGHGRQRWTESGRQTGAGVFVYRNVFDFRRPVMYQWPAGPEEELVSIGRISGDHGGPAWEPIFFYHNTVVTTKPMSNAYYGGELAGHVGAGFTRRVFNNIFVQTEGVPSQRFPEIVLAPDGDQKSLATRPGKGTAKTPDLLDGDDVLDSAKSRKGAEKPESLDVDSRVTRDLEEAEASRKAAPKPPTDFQADGNLHWGVAEGAGVKKFLAAFRDSEEFERSCTLYPAGWTAHDQFADPKFLEFAADWHASLDLRLKKGSPAIDAGVALPDDWPASTNDADAGLPDLGALPAGVEMPVVGMRGRLTLGGAAREPGETPAVSWAFPAEHERVSMRDDVNPALLFLGYPAFEAPLLEFALERNRIRVERIERTWPDSRTFSKYSLIAIDGSLARAGIQPTKFSPDDVTNVRHFMEQGGTLLLMRERTDLFASGEGRKFLNEVLGAGKPEGKVKLTVRLPGHPWVKHLMEGPAPEWLGTGTASPLKAGRGEVVIGSEAGSAILYRAEVGRGQLIYVGWNVSSALPNGRTSSTAAAETQYEQQMGILLKIAEDVAGRTR